MADATSTQIVSYIALAIAVGGMVVGVFNHKVLRSRCFGREASISIDIDNTTPRGALATPILAPADQSRPTTPVV
jgi:hypothetical protein